MSRKAVRRLGKIADAEYSVLSRNGASSAMSCVRSTASFHSRRKYPSIRASVCAQTTAMTKKQTNAYGILTYPFVSPRNGVDMAPIGVVVVRFKI
jgi:hypothetical protein